MNVLTIGQAAQELGVSVSRMQQLVKSKKLEHGRIGRAIVINPRDLEAVPVRPTGRPQKAVMTLKGAQEVA